MVTELSSKMEFGNNEQLEWLKTNIFNYIQITLRRYSALSNIVEELTRTMEFINEEQLAWLKANVISYIEDPLNQRRVLDFILDNKLVSRDAEDQVIRIPSDIINDRGDDIFEQQAQATLCA